jgi:hypothetical protein
MPRVLVATWLLAAGLVAAPRASAQQPPAPPPVDPARQALADELSRLIKSEIPREYDRQKDWGATREITVGYRAEGKPFHLHVHRRKKAVEHGVWKHYKLRMIEPDERLSVTLTELEPLPGGRVAFKLAVDAQLDAWARAKVYQYGVHVVALELEGDMRVRLAIAGEVGLRVQAVDGAPGVAVEPRVTDARLDIDDLHVRRVSNASGPLVDLLGEGARKLVEEELDGPRLAEKLNRSIDKKRDRLVFGAGELMTSPWRTLAAGSSAEPAQP